MNGTTASPVHGGDTSKTLATGAAAAPFRIRASAPESSTASAPWASASGTAPAPAKTTATPSASLEARLAALQERRQAREARAFGKATPTSTSTSAASATSATKPRPATTAPGNGAAPPKVVLTSPPPPIPLAPASPSRSPTAAPAPPARANAVPLAFSLHDGGGSVGKAAAATAHDAAHPHGGNGPAYTVSSAGTPARATGSVGGVTAERPPLPAFTSPLRRFPSTASSVSTTACSEAALPNRSFTAFSVRDSPPSHPLGPAPMLSRAGTPTESASTTVGSAAASPEDRQAGAAEALQRTPSPESRASPARDEWREGAMRASASLPDLPSPPPPPSMRNGHTAQLLLSYQLRSFSASATSSTYMSPAEECVEAATPPPPSPPLGANGYSASASLMAPPPLHTRDAAVAFASTSLLLSPSPPSLPSADEALATVSPTEASSLSDVPTPSRQAAQVVDGQHSWAVPVQGRCSFVAPLPPSPPQPASSLGHSSNGREVSAPPLRQGTAEAALATAPAKRRSSSRPSSEGTLWRPDWRDAIVAGVRVCRDSPHVRRTRCSSRERSRTERGGAPVWSASSPGAWDRRTRSASTDRDASVPSVQSAAATATPPFSSFQQHTTERHHTAASARPLLSAALRPVLLATTVGSRYKLLDDAAAPAAAAPVTAAAAGPDIIAEELHMRLVLSRLKAESAQRRLEQRRHLSSGVL